MIESCVILRRDDEESLIAQSRYLWYQKAGISDSTTRESEILHCVQNDIDCVQNDKAKRSEWQLCPSSRGGTTWRSTLSMTLFFKNKKNPTEVRFSYDWWSSIATMRKTSPSQMPMALYCLLIRKYRFCSLRGSRILICDHHRTYHANILFFAFKKLSQICLFLQ